MEDQQPARTSPSHSQSASEPSIDVEVTSDHALSGSLLPQPVFRQLTTSSKNNTTFSFNKAWSSQELASCLSGANPSELSINLFDAIRKVDSDYKIDSVTVTGKITLNLGVNLKAAHPLIVSEEVMSFIRTFAAFIALEKYTVAIITPNEAHVINPDHFEVLSVRYQGGVYQYIVHAYDELLRGCQHAIERNDLGHPLKPLKSIFDDYEFSEVDAKGFVRGYLEDRRKDCVQYLNAYRQCVQEKTSYTKKNRAMLRDMYNKLDKAVLTTIRNEEATRAM